MLCRVIGVAANRHCCKSTPLPPLFECVSFSGYTIAAAPAAIAIFMAKQNCIFRKLWLQNCDDWFCTTAHLHHRRLPCCAVLYKAYHRSTMTTTYKTTRMCTQEHYYWGWQKCARIKKIWGTTADVVGDELLQEGGPRWRRWRPVCCRLISLRTKRLCLTRYCNETNL